MTQLPLEVYRIDMKYIILINNLEMLYGWNNRIYMKFLYFYTFRSGKYGSGYRY